MPKLRFTDRLDRVEWLYGRPNRATDGFAVKVSNGVDDSTWITVDQETGERVLRALRAALLFGEKS